MDGYDIPTAVKPIIPFLDDASNWYVRRSRRRFWKSDDDGDKQSAYRTLHYVLTRVSQVLAPFAPFMAEELFRKLTNNESVHLTDWPEVGRVNEFVIERMTRTRDVIEQGLGLRMKRDDEHGQIKIRQPLATLTYNGDTLDEFYETIIAEEVNVKAVDGGSEEVTLDKVITHELHREGLSREVIRHVQSARKNSGLNIDDRISLSLKTDDEILKQAITEYADVIAVETLAEGGLSDADYEHSADATIEGMALTVSLQRV